MNTDKNQVEVDSPRIVMGDHNPFAKGFDRSNRTKRLPEEGGKTEIPAEPQEDQKLADGKITVGEEGQIKIEPTWGPDSTKEVEDTNTTPTEDRQTAQGEDTGAPTDEESTNPALDTLYRNVALQMKEDGYISEDVEIPDDIDGDTAYSLYIQGAEKRVEEQVQTRTNQALQSLKEAGVNEQDLSFAMAIRAGTDPALLYTNSLYEKYSQLDEKEVTEDKKIEVIKKGLELSGLSAERAEKYVSALEIEGDEAIDAEFTEHKKEFKNRYEQFMSEESQKAQAALQAREAKEKSNNEFFQNVITTASIKDEPLSPTQVEDIKNSLLVADQVVERGGQQFRATKFEKFLLDIQEDFQTQLYLYKVMEFRGEELSGVKAKAKEQATKDFMGRFPSEVEKTKKSNNKSNFTSKFSSFGEKVAGSL